MRSGRMRWRKSIAVPNGLSLSFSFGFLPDVIAVSEFEKGNRQKKENVCSQKIIIIFPEQFRH